MSKHLALLSLLAEGGNTGFWSYNPDTKTVFPDASSCTLLRCRQAASSFPELLAGVHPDDLAGLQSDIQRSIAVQDSFSRNFRLRGDGAGCSLSMRGRWSGTTDSAHGEFVCVVERAQPAPLQMQEHRFGQLCRALEGSPVVVYEQDAQLRYEWVLAPRVGLHPDAITGRKASEFLEPDSAQEIDSAKQRVMERGKASRQRLQIQPKGRAGGVFDVYMAPRLGLDGKVNGVISVAIDIAETTAQEQRMLAIFERAPVAITLSRQSDGIFLKANDNFLELMGYTREEIIGSSTLALGLWHPPESRDRMLAELQSTGHVRNMIGGYRKKSGKTGRLLVSVEPIEVAGEQLILGMMTDITDLEEAKQALALSEARYKLLSEASFEGVGLARDGLVVDANEQIARILGVRREDLIGQPVTRNMRQADVPRALQAFRAGGNSFNEYEYLRPDGKRVILEVNSKDLVEGDQVLRISALRDVTEKHQKELELQNLQIRFARMVDSNMVGVYVGCPDGEILEANDYFLNLIGCDRADLDNGLLNWIELTQPQSMQVSLNARDELARSGVCPPYEKEFRKADGSTAQVSVALAHLPAAVTQNLAIVIDISALKAAQTQLQEMNFQLVERTRAAERAEAAKTLFLSSVSHELRTPLHTMLGHVRLLRKKAKGEDLQQLSVVERSSNHLLQLIEDLLEYNHSTIAPERLEPEVVVLAGFLTSLQLIGNAATADSDNQFFIELSDGLPATMVVDERRLTQVLRILVDNACKYTRSGLVVFTLSLEGERRSAETGAPCSLRFSVEDNGRGMEAADVSRIFEPLKRGSNATDRQGLGLGLAIAAQWIERMGGKIAVESMRGVGSHFSFVLDLAVSFAAVPTIQELLHSEPVAPPVPQTKVALHALPEKELNTLGQLVYMGRLGRLRDWAHSLQMRYPQHQEAAQLVVQLAGNADMDALEALVGRWSALGSQ
jgi:PAS domain S-box-containing protein